MSDLTIYSKGKIENPRGPSKTVAEGGSGKCPEALSVSRHRSRIRQQKYLMHRGCPSSSTYVYTYFADLYL